MASLRTDLENSERHMIVAFVRYVHAHHAYVSGFHQLVKWWPGPCECVDVGPSRWPWAIEATLITRGRRGRGKVYFHLYGESTYRVSGCLKREVDVVGAAFHQPPSVLEKMYLGASLYARVRARALRCLDFIAVVSRWQISFFQSIAPRVPVLFIPHGVDVSYFAPAASNRPRRSGYCITVGHWLRDWKVLAEAVELVDARCPDLSFVIVSESAGARAIRSPRVKLYRSISDEELRSLYWGAEFCVLPLKDSTANNALLEAMASGLPLVVTDVGGVRDYVCTNCAILVPPNDPDALARAIVELHQDVARRARMGQLAAEHARRFAWPIVARAALDQIQAVYEERLG